MPTTPTPDPARQGTDPARLPDPLRFYRVDFATLTSQLLPVLLRRGPACGPGWRPCSAP